MILQYMIIAYTLLNTCFTSTLKVQVISHFGALTSSDMQYFDGQDIIFLQKLFSIEFSGFLGKHRSSARAWRKLAIQEMMSTQQPPLSLGDHNSNYSDP